MPTRNLRDGELTIEDGSSTPKTAAVALDNGELAWAETNPVVNVLDRGTLSHMRPGKQAPVVGSFRIRFHEFLSDGDAASPHEALAHQGAAAGWTSTNIDNGGVYTVRLVFTIADPDAGELDEEITFEKVCPIAIGFRQGDRYDTLTVEFQDFETAPDVAKT